MAQCADPAGEPMSKELREISMDGFALLLAGANVVMQLARRPVAYGVIESPVAAGSLYRHPVKRTRTTLSYIALALWGSDAERLVLGRDVGRQHRLVRERANSPVAYSAFDPELQLWVAACMYRGLEDAMRLFRSNVRDEMLDELYRHSARFATTLQVDASSWPGDRVAFARYWDRAVEGIAMDEVTRSYLYDLVSLGFLSRPVRRLVGPLHRFVTTGFLPERFREELAVSWGPLRQRVFDAFVRTVTVLEVVTPGALRRLPWALCLWDARRRIRRGRSIV